MKTKVIKNAVTVKADPTSRLAWTLGGNGCTFVVLLAATMVLLIGGRSEAQEPSQLTVETDGHYVHVMPTPSAAGTWNSTDPSSGALIYHNGPVMTTSNTYAIFWIPASGKLQNGAPTSLPYHYQQVVMSFLYRYPGHGIDNNNTQYFQQVSGGWNWIQNAGSFAGYYIDTSSYPASDCNDPDTPGNCLSDAQIQAEIQKVMSSQGWNSGMNNMFLLFTSSGEGSCAGSTCAYSTYCAYHSYFGNTSSPVIYGNEPYAAQGFCQAGTSPNNDPAADAAASIASHEITEAITDPEFNAWFASNGAEIGDLCAWNYGVNTWDSGNANQSWFTHATVFGGYGYYELQREYDNHTASCVQVGP